MCGIFGYIAIGKIEKHAELFKYITELNIASEERGKDATGFSAWWGKTGNTMSDKMPVRPTVFVEMSDAWAALKGEMPSSIIGHARATTSGSAAVNNNNHPFRGERFDLVHNGVISDWQAKVAKLDLDVTTGTDSEIYLRYLENAFKSGPNWFENTEDALGGMAKDIGGLFAIALLNKDDGSLLIARNGHRPIYKFSTEYFGCPTYFFASTEEILVNAALKCMNTGFSMRTRTSQVEVVEPYRAYLYSHSKIKVPGERYYNCLAYDFETPSGESRNSETTKTTALYSTYQQKTETFKLPTSARPGDTIDGLTWLEHSLLEEMINKIVEIHGNSGASSTVMLDGFDFNDKVAAEWENGKRNGQKW